MDLTTYLKMDPNLLYGLLNTELRDFCSDLDDLVKKHGLDRKKLETRMKKAGYEYKPELKQFR